MVGRNLFAAIFVFGCVLTCKGEDFETYDENGYGIVHCTDGRVLYSAGCEDPTMSERTCSNPNAHSLGFRCDYSRCDCPDPKVWDEAAKKCVKVDECSKQSNVSSKDEEKC